MVIKPLLSLALLVATAAGAEGRASAVRGDPGELEHAAAAALTARETRLEVIGLEVAGPPCVASRYEVPPLSRSGRFAVRILGRGCTAWGWLRVRLVGPSLRLRRAVRAGEPLADAIEVVERERTTGRSAPTALPEAAVAKRSLPAGSWLEENDVRVGKAPGEPVRVVLELGALQLEQAGRLVPCMPGRTCAVLPSGRHVEGRLDNDRLVVEER